MSKDLPRIVSLLPSATEIVCALGLADSPVGLTHECDYPPVNSDRPRLPGGCKESFQPCAVKRSGLLTRPRISVAPARVSLTAERLRRAFCNLVLSAHLFEHGAVRVEAELMGS
jgi:iron complex transport system substrate-binding protein